MRRAVVLLLLISPTLRAEPPAKAELVEVRKIWDRAPHNAFTDLIRFKDRWFCVFREGKAHVSPDGALRVITSADGKEWESAALIQDPKADLRDAKITTTPDGKLMLGGAAALHDRSKFSHQSYVWFSGDGHKWSEAVPVADPNYWLWRITWHGDTGYGIGYECGKVQDIRLYRSRDGRKFETLVEKLHDQGYPNETSIVFAPDGTALCLLRRDKGSGLLGRAEAPYEKWTWQDLGVRIGGPHMIRLPNGRLFAAVRLHEGKVRTGLCEIDPKAGKLTEVLTLPSGGDTSYAGLVWQDEQLWVSYYSSHEGKTSIYLARVRIPPSAHRKN